MFAPAIAGTARSRDGNFLPGSYITAAGGSGQFALVAGGQAAPLVVDASDYPGVVRENPETGTWAPAYFGPGLAPGSPGGLNHKYYEKIFELALRLKAN